MDHWTTVSATTNRVFLLKKNQPVVTIFRGLGYVGERTCWYSLWNYQQGLSFKVKSTRCYSTNFNFCPPVSQRSHWRSAFVASRGQCRSGLIERFGMVRYENTIGTVTKITSMPSEASVAGAPLGTPKRSSRLAKRTKIKVRTVLSFENWGYVEKEPVDSFEGCIFGYSSLHSLPTIQQKTEPSKLRTESFSHTSQSS